MVCLNWDPDLECALNLLSALFLPVLVEGSRMQSAGWMGFTNDQSPRSLVIRSHMYTITLLHFSVDRKDFVLRIHLWQLYVDVVVCISSLIICAFLLSYCVVCTDSEDSLGIIFYLIFFYLNSGPDFLQLYT